MTLSVVVCTRDRGSQVLAAVRSILACAAGDFELIVVDQSAGGDTARSLTALSDTRLRYVPSDTCGLSHARNLGVRLARGSIVAMTDDDCTVEPSFASEVLRAFDEDPRIGLVFGNVLPAPHDTSTGFVPGYRREQPFLARSLADKAEVEGMGACMAVRRQALLGLAGFDERLGAGSALRAGEDVDVTVRMLAAGWAVYETPRLSVTHHRYHPWSEAATLVRGYWLGAGAAIGKHVTGRPWHGVMLLARLGRRFVVSRSRVAQSLGRAGLGLTRLGVFARGLLAGVRLGAMPLSGLQRLADSGRQDAA